MKGPDIPHGKVLYVGHLTRGQTSLMRAEAMARLGVDVARFDVRRFLDPRSFLERRVGAAVGVSPALAALNRALRATVDEVKPAAVWFDKQAFVSPRTVARIKASGACLVFSTPDPLFHHFSQRTAAIKAAFAAVDLFVTTKSYELDAYRRLGPVVYMPQGYCPDVHRPVPVPCAEMVDAAFVGTWEPRREALLRAITRRDLSVRIRGYGWDHVVDGRAGPRHALRLRRLANGAPYSVRHRPELAGSLAPGEIYGEYYARAVSAGRIGLGLLRTTLCADQHTTRTFEIPACGAMLLADRTNEHLELFEEDREAVFASDEDEFADKAAYYAHNDAARERIAAAGQARCVASGYSYTDRLRPVMAEVARLVGRRVVHAVGGLCLEVDFLGRKPFPGQHSIEGSFRRTADALRRRGLDVRERRAPCHSIGLMNRVRIAAFAARRTGADVLHVTGDIHFAVLAARGPVVLTIHDLERLSVLSGWRRSVFRTLWFTLPCKRADAIMVISEATRDRLVAEVPGIAAKVHVVPVLVAERYRAVARPFAEPSGGSVPTILQIGTKANKNVPRLAQALRGLDVRLVIVGHVSSDLASTLDGAGVPWTAHEGVSEDAMAALYAAADIVTLVSTEEGFGMPIVEAQRVGRPVVTSAAGAMQEVAGDGAVLVDPVNVASIRAGLVSVLTDAGLRERLVEAGRRNAHRYDPDAAALKLCAVYRSVRPAAKVGAERVRAETATSS